MDMCWLGFFSKPLLNVDAAPGVFVWNERPNPYLEFKWAQTHPAVSRGLAQVNLAADRAGKMALSSTVRSLKVLENLDGWRGEKEALSRSWVERSIS